MLTQLAKGKRMAACTPVLAVLVLLWLGQAPSQAAPRHSQGRNTGRHRKKIRCHCLRPSFPQASPTRTGSRSARRSISRPSRSLSPTPFVPETRSAVSRKAQHHDHAIATANGISDPRKLRPGQKLKITKGGSGSKPTKPKPAYIPADTLSKINRPGFDVAAGNTSSSTTAATTPTAFRAWNIITGECAAWRTGWHIISLSATA